MPLHRLFSCSSILFALFVCVAAPASAVSLNSQGLGQVLVYPYYTANAGNDTLLSVTNPTPHGKALRVRFAEGENGRDAYSLNVYLAPFDAWTAAITHAGAGADAPAGVRTSDASCTVPDVAGSTDLTGGGAAFSMAAFSGANSDPGGSSASRTTEGWIEIIEMGSLVDESPSAVSAGMTSPGETQTRDCAALVAAWAAGGYWAQDANTDVLNPTGGLYGSAYVVNVEQGTIFGYSAVALDDFRVDPADSPRGSTASVVLHTPAGNADPNLGDALTDPTAHLAQADAFADGHIAATYTAPANAVDAVTAVFMAAAIFDDYATDTSIGATTNLVFTYPTRRFYTDPAIAGAQPVLPFTQLFAGIRANSPTEVIPYGFDDREGSNTAIINCGVDACTNRLQSPGSSVEILSLGDGAQAIFASALEMGFDSPGSSPLFYSPSGWITFLADGANEVSEFMPGNEFYSGNGLPALRLMRPTLDGKYFAGIPVTGFAVQNLVNGNVQNGVLANYSSVTPHRSTSACYVAGTQNGGHCS